MARFVKFFPKITIWASLLLFAACLFFDGYSIEPTATEPNGWAPAFGIFILGWTGLMYGLFTWLANPALILAWILQVKKKRILSLIASVVALAFMVSFLFKLKMPANEAPTYSRIIAYGVGFWLWLVSGCVQILGAAVAVGGRQVIVSDSSAD